MSLLTRSKLQKRRDVRFSPAPPDGRRSSFGLEPRSLARPAFYFLSGPGILDQVEAQATNGTTSIGVSVAATGSTLVETGGGFFGTPVVTFTQLGSVKSQIVDSGVSGTGTYGVSATFSQIHNLTVSPNPLGVGPNNPSIYTTQATGNRSYLLADDGVSPSGGPVTLVQTLNITIVGPTHVGNVIVTGNLAFAGDGFAVGTPLLGAPQVTRLDPGTTILQSTTTNGPLTSFQLTASTPFPAGLPKAPGGVRIDIAYASTLTTDLGGNQLSDIVSVTTNYGAHF